MSEMNAHGSTNETREDDGRCGVDQRACTGSFLQLIINTNNQLVVITRQQ